MNEETLPLRIALVGASSLLAKELREVLEAGRFAASEFRLLDDETFAGTLTEASGEPVLIQSVDEQSFSRARFAFFAGDPAFTAAHWREAQHAGASVIDLSGGLSAEAGTAAWIPHLQKLLPPHKLPGKGDALISPSAAAIIACSVVAALAPLGVERMAILFLRPVSERGQAGIAELESQTVNLLSFQTIAQDVFGTQVAFNLLDRYGISNGQPLEVVRVAIAREVERYLDRRAVVPAIQIIQAPVFHSTAFSIYAELHEKPETEALARAALDAGIKIAAKDDAAPSNVSVAGEKQIVIRPPERDPNSEHSWWIWGAADNLRLSATNAARIAENLLDL